MIRRISECRKWIVVVLLLGGSTGCSTWSDSLPMSESMVSPSLDGNPAFDLAPSARVQGIQESGDKTPDVRLDERQPASDQRRADAATEELRSDDTHSAVEPADSSSPLLAQVKPSQAEGPGDLLRDPEPAKDENYDPFAKPGETLEVEEYDPLEPFNRAMFTFNRKFDEYLLRPVAKAYEKVVPDGLEEGFSNAFRNIRTVPRFFNNIFQGKFKGATIEASRLVINSSLGLAGFLDFAKEVFHLETLPEDTGQTLGTYGVKPGPYLVLPFLGSFTIRDGIGFVGDLALDPFNWLLFPIVEIDGSPAVVTNEDTILFAQLGIRAGYMVNERALNIETTFEDLEKSTVDLYAAVRNAYLQKRAQAIRE